MRALQNYYEAMRLEIDPMTEVITLNIGYPHSNGNNESFGIFFERSNEPFLPQAFNYGRDLSLQLTGEPYEVGNSSSTVLREGLTHLSTGEQAIRQGDSEIAEAWFDQAAEYWKQAIALTPGNYIEAHNWLKITRRFE
uniref:Putative photosystem I assembly protein Ycf3 n=1 Tax=Helianthus annuus TaxID=4232 RepID=A0A1Y3BUX4_HELAN